MISMESQSIFFKEILPKIPRKRKKQRRQRKSRKLNQNRRIMRIRIQQTERIQTKSKLRVRRVVTNTKEGRVEERREA
jgi:hypothetical protein